MRDRFRRPGEQWQAIMPFNQRQAVPGREIAEAARPQDAPQFRHEPRGVRDVLIDVGAGDRVERGVGKRERHGITVREDEVRLAVARLGMRYGGSVDVDACHMSERFGVGRGEEARGAADVQQAERAQCPPSAVGARREIAHDRDRFGRLLSAAGRCVHLWVRPREFELVARRVDALALSCQRRHFRAPAPVHLRYTRGSR